MKSRRGIGSVVGTVFAILALSTTVGYITYSMNVLDKYNQSILTTNQNAIDRSKEQIQITKVTIDNNRFNITAVNTGNIPIHLTRLWATNTTDPTKVFRYNINYNLTTVTPQSKIGQSLSLIARTNQAYDIKLISERGNVKEFTVNSVSTAPLNIQFIALPSYIPSGFTTTLVMLVTNNGTGTLTNVTPATPTNTAGTADSCGTPVLVGPSNYNTLPPGSSATFSWNVIVQGSITGMTCTYRAQLQNGYTGNYAQTVITIKEISFTSTTLAQNSGILTLNYTTLRWSEGTSWTAGWGPPGSNNIAFYVNVTNNNQTQGSNLYISKNSLLYTTTTSGGASSQAYYIVNNVTKTLSATAYSCAGPPANDYCLNVGPGKSITLQFYAASVGGSTQPGSSKLPVPGTALALNLIIFGKYATCQNCVGSEYGQLLPYNGILTQ